ncbi:MAG: 5-methyltetrahydropteroyltriglutamate--homocysteine S-methyltransferase [Sinobacteraceae bacterium]|nr:5-methyltetrahydropteroyltriglutamate--homocysteine S-methyltransferase [Nevskiaceae bacterium]
MLTHNLGYPRIGDHRELKKACEGYWSCRLSAADLQAVASTLRRRHWDVQRAAGIDLVPCNDFSLYDHVLDWSLTVGAIPARYQSLLDRYGPGLELYFAMARGGWQARGDLIPLEMTKWFDTNYHYLVPEFTRQQTFSWLARKPLAEFEEARALGVPAKPVLLGPVSYLLLGKEKEPGFHRLELLDRLLPVYAQLLQALHAQGATYVQFDEPCLVLDLDATAKDAYRRAYRVIAAACPQLRYILATYFGALDDNLALAAALPVQVLHLDLARAPQQLEVALSGLVATQSVSLGLVDGRNVWKNDYARSLEMISRAVERLGEERVWLAPSCSLLHVPCDLELERDETVLPPEVKRWLAFARQKLDEVATLRGLAQATTCKEYTAHLKQNLLDQEDRRRSLRVHRSAVQARLAMLRPEDEQRASPFAVRQDKQRRVFRLPWFPTTTIGSLPQTEEVRRLRQRLKDQTLSAEQYEAAIRSQIERAIRWQEELDLDVLVHGEFERNDMVEYFGERLTGFATTVNGWVQSYGTRCVKPPVLYGDVERQAPMTVVWSTYAQSLTPRPVKGMLTGPVTILQWSFVRDDQPRAQTARQIALAIRDEVRDLEQAGIGMIQIDEPALREGLPLRRAAREDYLKWAGQAFRLAAAIAADETQIHTHMCYSEFNDIIEAIAALDADVITIETSRSQMELLDAFVAFRYPNEIGPGVYDIHSPRVPSAEEMVALLRKALAVLPARNLWVNPDCGLKTRGWAEAHEALANMVAAAKRLRAQMQA